MFRLGKSSSSSSALQIFLERTRNSQQSKGAHQELPKESRSDLQVPAGNAALARTAADPGSEGECSLRADGLTMTKTGLRTPHIVITTADTTNIPANRGKPG